MRQPDGHCGMVGRSRPVLRRAIMKNAHGCAIGKPTGVDDPMPDFAHIRLAVVGEDRVPGIDHGVERHRVEAAAVDRRSEGLDDLVAARMSRSDAVQRFSPPLQTDRPQHRLTYPIGNACQLQFKGMECKERITPVSPREQDRKIAVRVVTTDQRSAGVLPFHGFVHGEGLHMESEG
jgi:hypothetical protein